MGNSSMIPFFSSSAMFGYQRVSSTGVGKGPFLGILNSHHQNKYLEMKFILNNWVMWKFFGHKQQPLLELSSIFESIEMRMGISSINHPLFLPEGHKLGVSSTGRYWNVMSIRSVDHCAVDVDGVHHKNLAGSEFLRVSPIVNQPKFSKLVSMA